MNLVPTHVYKFVITFTDLTIKTISDGKLENYGDITYDRLGLIEPYGMNGYQVRFKDISPYKARQQVVKMLQSMGFKVSPVIARGK